MRREPGKIQRSRVDAERAREDTGDPESMQEDPQSRGERLYQPFSFVEIFFYFSCGNILMCSLQIYFNAWALNK
jgi:hypothetical protein